MAQRSPVQFLSVQTPFRHDFVHVISESIIVMALQQVRHLTATRNTGVAVFSGEEMRTPGFQAVLHIWKLFSELTIRAMRDLRRFCETPAEHRLLGV
jgi:hypothetical protein